MSTNKYYLLTESEVITGTSQTETVVYSPFHSSWKVTTLFTWNWGEGWVRTVREVEIIDMLISFFLMIIISTSLTVPTQPSPRFNVEACLPFRNCEKDYWPSNSTKQ